MIEDTTDRRRDVRDVVSFPTVADLWEVSATATSCKESLFKEMGFDMNHRITEGDVRCVLKALKQVADGKI